MRLVDVPRNALALAAWVAAVLGALGRVARADEPTTRDCLAAYEDSVKLKNAGHLRATRGKLLVCSSESCPADIRGECIWRVREVDAAMPTVVFEVKGAPGEDDLSDVTVSMDGEVVATRLEGTALFVDPGPHKFTFEAAGHPKLEKQLTMIEGDKVRREQIRLAPAATPRASASAAPPPAAIAVAPPPPEIEARHAPRAEPAPRLGAERTAALVAGGVGVGALAVGAIFGWIAISRRDTADDACPDKCANAAQQQLWNRAASAGNVSTIAALVGVAALAAGVTLWVVGKAPAEGGAGTQIGLGLGSVELDGRW
jgi:hypothetical protein